MSKDLAGLLFRHPFSSTALDTSASRYKCDIPARRLCSPGAADLLYGTGTPVRLTNKSTPTQLNLSLNECVRVYLGTRPTQGTSRHRLEPELKYTAVTITSRDLYHPHRGRWRDCRYGFHASLSGFAHGSNGVPCRGPRASNVINA